MTTNEKGEWVKEIRSTDELDNSAPSWTIPQKLGPWTLENVLYNDGKNVFIVSTSNPLWVIKIFFGSPPNTDELAHLLMMRHLGVQHCVHIPTSVEHQFGTGPSYMWIAMKRYTGHVEVKPFFRENWRRIATTVLVFLRDLHINCSRVYMDIKTTNILYHLESERSHFVVADYELVDTVELSRPTRTFSNNTKWYYIAMGAELDEPLYSWRMDLVALGYTLASLTHDYSVKPLWKYYDQCMQRRANKLSFDISDESIVALRSIEMQEEHPLILRYLHLVSELPWNSPVPPSNDFYARLISVFQN